MRSLSVLAGAGLFGLFATQSLAGVCDYKPSAWLGDTNTTTIIATAGTATVTGLTAKAAGFYTLVHASSGLTMIGSTMAGTSAAGTIGIIGGTGGLAGAAASTVIWLPFIVVTGAIAAATGGYEAGCLLAVERVTDYNDVLAVMQEVAKYADEDLFRIATMANGRAAIIISDGTETAAYPVEDLYIADGVLKHRDWFLNTTVAEVAWVQVVAEE